MRIEKLSKKEIQEIVATELATNFELPAKVILSKFGLTPKSWRKLCDEVKKENVHK